MRIVLLSCWALLCSAAPLLGAQTGPASDPAVLDADRLSFDKANDQFDAEGHVVVQYHGEVLRADRVRYRPATKEAWAEGNVQLRSDGQEWSAPAAYYNFQTRVLKTSQARGVLHETTGSQAAPVYVTGQEVSSTGSNAFAVARLSLTPCEYEHPHFRLEAGRAEVWAGERILLYNVTVRAGNVPVFWLPVLAWSLNPNLTPFGIAVGHSDRLGTMVLTTTSWRFNKHLSLSVDLDERTRRGLGGGTTLDYNFPAMSGELGGYFLHDQEPQDDLDRYLGRAIPADRYRGHWSHRQQIGSNLRLLANFEKQSDSDFTQDFFETLYRRQIEPTSFADLTYRAPQFALSAFTRVQLNQFHAEVERLPELRLDWMRTPLWDSGLFYEGASSAGYYANDAGLTGDPLMTGESVRVDTFHQLSRPMLWFNWLSIVPRAGLRGTWYETGPAPNTNETFRGVANLGSEFSFRLWRQWNDFQLPKLDLDGLRYMLEPFAEYQWVPAPTEPAADLYQFDTLRTISLGSGEVIPLARYLPLSFPANTATDAIQEQNQVRFGLRQKLQTRRDRRTWDLVELDGWTDYHFERPDGPAQFDDLYGTIRLRPTRSLAAGATVRHDLEAGRVREFNTETTVTGAAWSAGIATRFAEQDSNQVEFRWSSRLTKGWHLQLSQGLDIHNGRWIGGEYNLRQETHDWWLTYGLRYRGQDLLEDELTLFVSVALKAFPGVRLKLN